MKFFNHFIHGTLLLTMFFCTNPMEHSMDKDEIIINNPAMPPYHSKLYFLSKKYILSIGMGEASTFVWNIKKKKMHHQICLSGNTYYSTALSSNKKLMAMTVLHQNKIELFNINKNFILMKTLNTEGFELKIAFSPFDKRLLASTGYAKKIIFWNIISGKKVKEINNRRGNYIPNDLQFSSDGTKIACGFSDSAIQIWDVQSKELLNYCNLMPHSTIRCMLFHPDNKKIIITKMKISSTIDELCLPDNLYHDLEALLWDIKKESHTHDNIFGIKLNDTNNQMLLFGKNTKILSMSLKGQIDLWDLKSEKIINLKLPTDNIIYDSLVKFKNLIAYATHDGKIIIRKLPKNIEEQL